MNLLYTNFEMLVLGASKGLFKDVRPDKKLAIV